jgi:hypothetical protein
MIQKSKQKYVFFNIWKKSFKNYLKIFEIFQLLKSHRGQRGSLSSRIRNAIFRVYREKNLPFINLKAAPNEIKTWKESPIVKECYDLLHSKINDDDDATWCGRILSKIWSDLSKASSEQIAFVVSLCEFFWILKMRILKTIINICELWQTKIM